MTQLGQSWRGRTPAAIAFAVAVLAGSLAGAAQAVDTILLNGKILTLDARSSVVAALAIRDDRIVATGAAADVRAHAGASTRGIELGGRTVIPDLIDSHIHAIRAGHWFAVEIECPLEQN
ncbi:MAG: hypothetical protein HY060_22380 [Proteobacteria bacterium]|nr:hypothetical protein [Pseudomonadota bacterium]